MEKRTVGILRILVLNENQRGDKSVFKIMYAMIFEDLHLNALDLIGKVD